MGGTVCTLAGGGRHSLSTATTCLNLILSFAGQVFVLVALILKFVLESRVAVVIGNHGGALAYFLIAVGCILCFVSVASSKVTYDAGSLETATRRTAKMLVFTQACQGLAMLLLLAAIIMCLVHKGLIRDALHTGIMAAIRLYRINPKIKMGIDNIQAGFHCCGSRSMTDWFKVHWIPMKFLNIDHPNVARYIVDGEFIKDDAPYSCCDIYVATPCVHHDVQNATAHKHLGATGTLYTSGCNDALEHYWRAKVLNPVLSLLLFVALLLALAMTLSRMLQTSLDGALDAGNPDGEGDAFCFRTLPCAALPSTDPTKVLSKKKGNGDETTDDRGDGGDRGKESQNRSANRRDDDGGDSGSSQEGGWEGGGGGGGGGEGGGGGGDSGGGGGGDSKTDKKGKKDKGKKKDGDKKKDKKGGKKDKKGKGKQEKKGKGKDKGKKKGSKKKGGKKGGKKKKKKPKKKKTKKKPKKKMKKSKSKGKRKKK